jgi:hypothetical protein
MAYAELIDNETLQVPRALERAVAHAAIEGASHAAKVGILRVATSA